MSTSPPTKITVALDWTPNTLHSGLFLALSHGLYAAANLAVTLLPPSPTYSETPAKLVARGAADLAICPSESCVAYAEGGSMRLQAVYAILQRDGSAVVATTELAGGVKELGRGAYGSYNARYEDDIVRYMVTRDGGDGAGVKIVADEGKLGLFEALRSGRVDATWVFLPWEGVEAEMDGVGLRVFRAGDYGVPYGYSPVIARDAGREGGVGGEALRRFVRATREGYKIATRDVRGAAEEMRKHCTPERSLEFLVKSQESVARFYGGGEGEGGLGYMQEEKWEAWVKWLMAQGLLRSADVTAAELFTNEFFE